MSFIIAFALTFVIGFWMDQPEYKRRKERKS
jgi:hypothetical protein